MPATITDWALLGTAAGACATPDALPHDAAWRPATVPGTVAHSLGVDLDAPGDLDGQDWWYRATVRWEGATGPHRLGFDGLATLVEAWIDGAPAFTAANMFVPRECVVEARGGRSELLLCFRSVAAELARKRPRPRWKTALVDHQNLRWIRTSLLGRIPGWTPRVPAIGPWRAVRVEAVPAAEVPDLAVRGAVVDGMPRLTVEGALRVREGAGAVTGATLHLGARALAVPVHDGALDGAFDVPDAPLWWPHTHGEPHLEPWRLVLSTPEGDVEAGAGRVGFRTIEVDRRDGGVELRVNGRRVFARGACWTTDDVRALDGAPEVLAESLRLAREAGANLLRVGGTMTWESEAFYAGCDERGILVWQDLPLANMDYPHGDPAFAAALEEELRVQLVRLARHASVAVYCGGSEIEQQAAMMGLPPADGTGPFYQEVAPRLVAALHPGAAWFPSTPTGGALPFHTGTGLTHYYGVGAYRRPLTDVRRARVRFTPECLGFANVPEPETMHVMFGGATPPPHHPAWKAGVPRDNGAGWDFEDIRDHYLAELYAVDPGRLRSVDVERYYALSRVVTGELMHRTYAEWRRPGSGCGGGLVWFWKDLRPGAGWGVVDSTNRPKAAWWALRRAWARRTVLVTDEGLDGLDLHVVNEHDTPLEATVELELWRDGRRLVGSGSAPVTVEAFGATTLSGDALLGRFTDLTWAYRFGPPGHDVVVARLRDGEATLGEDFWFPAGHALPPQPEGVLAATAEVGEDGGVVVTLESAAFLQTVSFSTVGYTPDDAYFHLAPGRPRRVRFTPGPAARAFRVHVSALNLPDAVTVRAG